jgi:hypothetical protein
VEIDFCMNRERGSVQVRALFVEAVLTHPERDWRQKGILLIPKHTDERGERLGEIAFSTHRIDGIDSFFEAPV